MGQYLLSVHAAEGEAHEQSRPPEEMQKFMERVLQRGYRFLKHFRQRTTQSHSLRKDIEQIRETSYEHQRQPRRSIRA